jgi:hypothetical protein
MAALHKGHGGITKMRKLAQELYFWPGIANDIKMMVDGCRECQEGRASQPREPDQKFAPPDSAWDTIATDPFEYGGKDFLLVTDVLSGYPFVVKMGDKTTRTILRALEEIFLAYGYPREIISDHGGSSCRNSSGGARRDSSSTASASLPLTITRPTAMLRRGLKR